MAWLAAPFLYVIGAVVVGVTALATMAPESADSTADWLVASAATDGVSPYQDLRVLGDAYETRYEAPGRDEAGTQVWVHPRTPGALLTLVPLTLLTPTSVYQVTVVASLILLAFLGVVVFPRLMGRGWQAGLLLALVFVLSGPVLGAIRFGTAGAVIAVLVGLAWTDTRKGDSYLGGAALGVAIAIRLFPALLLLPLVAYSRRKTALVASGVAIALTVLGLLIFGLSPVETVDGMTAAGSSWLHLAGNGSLIAPLQRMSSLPIPLIVLMLCAAFTFFITSSSRRGLSFDFSMAMAIPGMLLISPLAWGHYDVILCLPIAAWIGERTHWPMRTAAIAWLSVFVLGLWMLGPDAAGGIESLLGRSALVIVAVLTGYSSWRQDPMVAEDPAHSS